MTLDRKRRAVEYAIHDKELQYTRSKVDQVGDGDGDVDSRLSMKHNVRDS